jgi:hypothetical protein
MKAKIDKILETPADEREIVENGKIFKKALDIILIAINILWFTSPFILIPFKLDIITTNVIAICINLCTFTVNLITFIFIMKTFKKNTYGGSINKTTNNLWNNRCNRKSKHPCRTYYLKWLNVYSKYDCNVDMDVWNKRISCKKI